MKRLTPRKNATRLLVLISLVVLGTLLLLASFDTGDQARKEESD